MRDLEDSHIRETEKLASEQMLETLILLVKIRQAREERELRERFA